MGWIGAPARRMLRRALIAWALLGPVLYLLAGSTGHGWPGLAATATRVADLAGPSLLFLSSPVLVLPLLMGLLRQSWQADDEATESRVEADVGTSGPAGTQAADRSEQPLVRRKDSP